MVPSAGRQDRLGVLDAGQQLVERSGARGVHQTSPTGSRCRPGQVREHLAHGQLAVPGAGQVHVEGVVEPEQPLVAAAPSPAPR